MVVHAKKATTIAGMKNIPKISGIKPMIENEKALVGVGTELTMLAATPRIKSPNPPAAAAKDVEYESDESEYSGSPITLCAHAPFVSCKLFVVWKRYKRFQFLNANVHIFSFT